MAETFYIDYGYYTNVYKGAPISETDFDRYNARAQDKINALIGCHSVQEWQMESVKKATAAQVEYIKLNGIYTSNSSASKDGFTAGKISFSPTTRDSSVGASYNSISPDAREYLVPTGLLYRGLPCCDQHPPQS